MWSSGKSVESIVMGILYDQGNFKFEDKVSKHWPEFAKNGKENIRICDVLRHESGLPWFSEIPEKTEMMWTENVKKNKIGEFIENQTPHWPEKPDKPDSKFQYHSLTRGVILNEIIRRIDSKGRTIDEIIREEIKIENIFVTIKDDEKSKVCKQKHNDLSTTIKQLMIPKWAGRRMDITWEKFIWFMRNVNNIFGGFGNPIFPESLAVKTGQDNADLLQVMLICPIIGVCPL